MAPTTFLNDSVMDSTGEGRAIQSLPELCMLSKRSLKKVTAHSSQIFPNWWQADLLGFGSIPIQRVQISCTQSLLPKGSAMSYWEV